ncbi:helix-turn-helix domain-containing protein, partial [Mycobacterium sp. 1423905.2]|uniref:helix-turn-helix domain-containing protein n=1 Tax=Mycobacterium sp. 1423905.2 TaxID=1856859 RepID=UPI000AEBCDC2
MQSSGRDRLLAAALKLFADKGYGATSVADIQRASGLAPGSGALYKHFASKRDLLEAAVAHRMNSIVDAREQYDAEQPASVEDAVRNGGFQQVSLGREVLVQRSGTRRE